MAWIEDHNQRNWSFEEIIIKHHLPKLLKTIKKTIPEIRNRHTAKELIYYTTKVMNELKKLKN